MQLILMIPVLHVSICANIPKIAQEKKVSKFCMYLIIRLPVVVVVVPQRLCPSKPAPLMKRKQLAGECHRSSGLLMLSCVLMCGSAGE